MFKDIDSKTRFQVFAFLALMAIFAVAHLANRAIDARLWRLPPQPRVVEKRVEVPVKSPPFEATCCFCGNRLLITPPDPGQSVGLIISLPEKPPGPGKIVPLPEKK